MDYKSSNPFEQQEYQMAAPPAYTSVASSSGATVQVDLQTGFCQDGSAAPPSDIEAIKSIYGSISGINTLTEADTIIMLDDSESMRNFGYWALVEKTLSYLGPVVGAYDPDGISLYCLNGRGKSTEDKEKGIASQGWNGLKQAHEIKEVFMANTPMGTTPIYDRLNHILKPYLLRLARDPSNRPRPINILILTDGVADDTEGVEEQIGEICEALDKYDAPNNQIGIQFVQIGDLKVAEEHIRRSFKPQEVDDLIKKAYNDYEASKAWLAELDDNLHKEGGASRDIVDTKSAQDVLAEGGFTPKALVKILVGALSKRHDRMQ